MSQQRPVAVGEQLLGTAQALRAAGAEHEPGDERLSPWRHAGGPARTRPCSPRSRSRRSRPRAEPRACRPRRRPSSRRSGRRRSRPWRACASRLTVTTFARIDSAISAGVRAPMSRPAGTSIRSRSSADTPSPRSSPITPSPRLRAGHQAHVGQARLQTAAQRVQLVAPVRGHHQREVAGPGIERVAVRRHRVEPQLGAEPQDGAGDRRVAHHEHARGGHHGLEEDLDRPARQAGILDRHRAVLARHLPALRADRRPRRRTGGSSAAAPLRSASA